MFTFIVRRMVQSVPVVVIVTVLVFLALHAVPGDPILARGGMQIQLTPEQIAQLRAEVGLDQPIHIQYFRWVANALQGDLGISYYNQRRVSELVALRLPATLQLTAMSLLIALLIAMPVGILAAVKQHSLFDYLGTTLVTVGMALPGFWLAIMLVLVFSVTLGWLPAVGYTPLFQDPGLNLRHAALPALTLGFILAAPTMRFLRSSMLEVIRQDYIQAARAKGLAERSVMLGHALKNALIPTVTVVGLQLGHLLGGAVVVEWVFGWPGLGHLTVEAIKMRDYSVVQGSVTLFAVGFVLVNLLVDVVYGALDPRIRHTVAAGGAA